MKKFFNLISRQAIVSDPRNRIWDSIWNSKLPPKVVIFLWKLQWGVVPTNLLLQRRIILISNRCGWCGVIVESIEHLFWRCELAIWAWSYIGHWWSNYTSLQALGHFSLRKLFNVEKEDGISSIWALIIALTIWTIWTSRMKLFSRKKECQELVLKN